MRAPKEDKAEKAIDLSYRAMRTFGFLGLGTSGSSRMNTKLFVPAGVLDHRIGGERPSAPSSSQPVYTSGMDVPLAYAGEKISKDAPSVDEGKESPRSCGASNKIMTDTTMAAPARHTTAARIPKPLLARNELLRLLLFVVIFMVVDILSNRKEASQDHHGWVAASLVYHRVGRELGGHRRIQDIFSFASVFQPGGPIFRTRKKSIIMGGVTGHGQNPGAVLRLRWNSPYNLKGQNVRCTETK